MDQHHVEPAVFPTSTAGSHEACQHFLTFNVHMLEGVMLNQLNLCRASSSDGDSCTNCHFCGLTTGRTYGMGSTGQGVRNHCAEKGVVLTGVSTCNKQSCDGPNTVPLSHSFAVWWSSRPQHPMLWGINMMHFCQAFLSTIPQTMDTSIRRVFVLTPKSKKKKIVESLFRPRISFKLKPSGCYWVLLDAVSCCWGVLTSVIFGDLNAIGQIRFGSLFAVPIPHTLSVFSLLFTHINYKARFLRHRKVRQL